MFEYEKSIVARHLGATQDRVAGDERILAFICRNYAENAEKVIIKNVTVLFSEKKKELFLKDIEKLKLLINVSALVVK